MNRILWATVAMVLAATAPLAAEQKGKGKPKAADAAHHAEHDATHVAARVTFSTGEARIIHDHYAPRYRSLPPGLQKKIARGGSLPPGWRKKLQPFDADVERHLQPLPSDYGRGVIDGHAVIYNRRTQVVVDVAVLF